MNIAIIGGGWVGCHLALKLIKNHNVTIFEKKSELFTETSFNNQNRLHYGFHYPRNYKTRNLCKTTYERFLSDYNHIIDNVPNNIYCIANKKSLIDFKTFCDIFKDYEFINSDLYLKNTEGCVNTKEKFINHRLAKNFFNNNLKKITIHKEITKDDVDDMSNDYDYVINSTNNMLELYKHSDSFYELTVSLIYEKKSKTLFDAITIMDGKFFSIYPYGNNLFTLTDVEFTPIKIFYSSEEVNQYRDKIDDKTINNIRSKMENKVLEYYENFNYDFEYNGYFLSVKSKIKSESDERYPIIHKDGNIINCYTGKIQGIYIIEDYVNKLINE